jgi:hypothetical protein
MIHSYSQLYKLFWNLHFWFPDLNKEDAQTKEPFLPLKGFRNWGIPCMSGNSSIWYDCVIVKCGKTFIGAPDRYLSCELTMQASHQCIVANIWKIYGKESLRLNLLFSISRLCLFVLFEIVTVTAVSSLHHIWTKFASPMDFQKEIAWSDSVRLFPLFVVLWPEDQDLNLKLLGPGENSPLHDHHGTEDMTAMWARKTWWWEPTS